MVGVPVFLQDTYCNLGWTLLAADVNADSEPDLVIGSPFAQVEGNRRELWLHFTLAPVTVTKVELAGVGVRWVETPTALVCGAFSCIGILVLFSLLCMVSPEFSNILTLPDVPASDVDRFTDYTERIQWVDLDPKLGRRVGSSYPHGVSMEE